MAKDSLAIRFIGISRSKIHDDDKWIPSRIDRFYSPDFAISSVTVSVLSRESSGCSMLIAYNSTSKSANLSHQSSDFDAHARCGSRRIFCLHFCSYEPAVCSQFHNLYASFRKLENADRVLILDAFPSLLRTISPDRCVSLKFIVCDLRDLNKSSILNPAVVAREKPKNLVVIRRWDSNTPDDWTSIFKKATRQAERAH